MSGHCDASGAEEYGPRCITITRVVICEVWTRTTRSWTRATRAAVQAMQTCPALPTVDSGREGEYMGEQDGALLVRDAVPTTSIV